MISVAAIMVEDEVAVISKTDAVGIVVDVIKIVNEGTLHTFIAEPKKNPILERDIDVLYKVRNFT